MTSLSLVDYLVIVLYLGVVTLISLWTGRRQTSTSAYFIANRRIPSIAVGFTIMATTVSSATFVAIPGSVFSRDWWQMLYMAMAIVSLVIVVIFIVPFYRRVVRMSAYEYLEARFGYGARLYGSMGFVVLRLMDLGFTLYLTAVAVDVVTGWDIGTIVIAVGLFTLLYTLIGGIEAAIWTSVLQGVIFVGSAVLILGALLFKPAGGPLEVVETAFHAGKFSLGNFEWSADSLYRKEATAWVLILAGFFQFTRYYVTEQNVIQRYLVARTDADARHGVILGILTTVPTWFTFAFIGSCLWAFYQLTAASLPASVTAQPDNILPYFIATQLPAGLVGLILAGLLSSAMSSVSADLNSIATVMTRDYFARAFSKSSDKTQLLFGRIAVLFGGVVSTGAALLLTLTRSVSAYELVVISVSIVAGGTLGLFGLGFLTRRASRAGSYIGILVCLLFVSWSTVTGPLGVDLGFNFRMNGLLIGVLSHLLLFAAGYLASLLFGGYRPELTGLTVWDRIGKDQTQPSHD